VGGAIRILSGAARALSLCFIASHATRLLRAGTLVEIVSGFTSSSSKLVVSGYLVGTQQDAMFIPDGSVITLYAVPADRFDEQPSELPGGPRTL
jgi:hypothetical protein